ncbi:chaperone protein dnaJ 20, chloroplastic-like [Miscanthus floridulus]|uniref:chaperone protein dnaJ 20, chloroplastic-like n=1 Tax=Miscanthus floridulus TaxID=154761 RepID=UPI0034597F62
MSTGTIPIVRCAATVNTATVFGCRKSRCNVTATATSAGRRASASRRDYYKVLSLEHRPDVGAEEIKRAYRRLALRHHPDVCPPSRRAESTELFLELRRAYETLSDPARRVRYDADLRTDGGEVARRPGGVAFARDVWESQLCVLRARSEQRQRARSSQPQRPV